MLPLIPAALLCGALVGAHQTCVVPHGGKGVNDAIGLKSLLSNCSTDATIVFQEKTTYNIS